MAGATWKCSRLGARSVYTTQPCTSSQSHFIRSHMRSVHVWSVLTCRLHFWQNNRDLLHATAVTRGETDNEIRWLQHRKLTLEKTILPPLLSGLEPTTFPSRVRRSNHWALPAHLWPTFLMPERGVPRTYRRECTETEKIRICGPASVIGLEQMVGTLYRIHELMGNQRSNWRRDWA